MRSRGITLVEILIVLGILVVILSFAMPSVSGAATRAEMQAAVENVEWSLQSARNLARMTETAVSVNIPQARPDRPQTITYSSSDPGIRAQLAKLQVYTLPAGIVLVSDRDLIEFDDRGLVESPGRLLLASNVDEAVKEIIRID